MIFDIAMVVVILATWARVLLILLCDEKFSMLLIASVKMMTAGTTFMVLLVYILLALMIVFYAIFTPSEAEDETYKTISVSFISLFESFLGSYPWYADPIPENMVWLHTLAILFVVYLTNIFMLNYLVAILGDVYGAELEMAAFSYNTSKY